MLLTRLTNGFADMLGTRQGPRHHRLLQLATGHWEQRDHRRGTHLDADGAGQALRPAVVHRIDDRCIAFLIGDGHGGGGDPEHGWRDHLDLGKGTSHSVGVDHWDTQAGCQREWCRGIESARLRGGRVVDRAIEIRLKRQERVDDLRAPGQLLDHYRRCPHHRRNHDQAVVRDLIGRDELHRTILAERVDTHQLADIRVAPAPAAQHGSSTGDVLEIFRRDQPHQTSRVVPTERGRPLL